jgi:hypothetical protein
MKKINFKFESAEKADFIQTQINIFLEALSNFIEQKTDNKEDEQALAYEMSETFVATFFVYALVSSFEDDSVEVFEGAIKDFRTLLHRTLSDFGMEIH